MDVGISTACFYPEITDVALEHILQNGVKENCVKVIEMFLNTYSETKKEYARELKKKIDDKGVYISSVHPFTSKQEHSLFFSDYKRRFDDALEHYKMYYEFANEIGAKIVVLHGCINEVKIEDHDYFERFAKMREHAKAEGIILAQENVAPYKSHKIDFIKRMKDYLDGQVEFVFDIKQTVRAGEDTWGMLDAMGENIVHAHISDNITFITKSKYSVKSSDKKEDEFNVSGIDGIIDGSAILPESVFPVEKKICFDCLSIGEGEFDFYRFFHKLKSYGFNASVVLELYRQNYGEYAELYRSVEKIDRMAKSVYGN